MRAWTDLCNKKYSHVAENDFTQVLTDLRNALKQLETILCEFGQICATENALMQLETILCELR